MPKHIELELSTALYNQLRTLAQYNHSSVSSTCLGMIGWALNQSYWFDDYKEALRKKKEVKEETKTTSVDREKLEKLIAVCDLLEIDLNGLTR